MTNQHPLEVGSDQVALEALMRDRGVDRYRAQASAARGAGRLSRSHAGRDLVRRGAELTARALDGVDLGPASALAVDALAALTVQTLIDGAARRVTRATLIRELAGGIQDELLFRGLRRAHTALASRIQRRRWPGARKAALARVELGKGLFAYDTPPKDGVVLAAVVLFETAAERAGIFRRDTERAGRRRRDFVALTPEAEAWIADADAARESSRPWYLPMVEPPADWGPGVVGGYKTRIARRKPLVRAAGPAHVHALRRADMPEVYAAVNRAQRTPFEVDPVVLEVALELNRRGTVALPSTVAPVKGQDRRAWAAANNRWEEESHLRALTARTLSLAREFAGRPVYFPGMLDFRGRLYPVPQFLQPQGHDLARGLLRFARADKVLPLTPAALRWEAYGAQLWGEKGTTHELAAWSRARVSAIADVARDPLAERWWEDADEPWQFLAWALEYGEWAADPDFPVRHPVHLDATNNGLQLFALLLRDRGLAELTGVVDTPRPPDVYAAVAERAAATLARDPDPAARELLEFLGGVIPREAVKRPVMTLPYGVTKHTAHRYLKAWLTERQRERDAFPWGFKTDPPVAALSRHVWAAVLELCAPAVSAMGWLQGLAGAAHKAGVPLAWSAPTGFPVVQDYRTRRERRLRTQVLDAIRWVRVGYQDPIPDRARAVRGAAPNFVHSLDAAVLHRAVNLAAAAGVRDFSLVHDSYGVPPSLSPVMGAAVREAVASVFEGDPLTTLSESAKLYLLDVPEPPPMGGLDPREVLSSTYFC